MKKFCLLLACALCGFISANAQRLIPKQKGIEVVASVPVIKGEKFTAEMTERQADAGKLSLLCFMYASQN